MIRSVANLGQLSCGLLLQGPKRRNLISWAFSASQPISRGDRGMRDTEERGRAKAMRGARFNLPELQVRDGIGRGHPLPLISSSASPFPQAFHALIRPSTPGGSRRSTTTAGTGGGTPSTPRSPPASPPAPLHHPRRPVLRSSRTLRRCRSCPNHHATMGTAATVAVVVVVNAKEEGKVAAAVYLPSSSPRHPGPEATTPGRGSCTHIVCPCSGPPPRASSALVRLITRLSWPRREAAWVGPTSPGALL